MAPSTRWTRLSLPRVIPGAALALTAVLAAAGCATATAGTTSGASHSRGDAPVITAAQARAVFGTYLATTARANRTGDGKLALSVVTAAAQAAVSTALQEARFSGGSPSLAPYSYRNPAFYLPEGSSYPHFFVASATRRYAGPRGSAPAGQPIGGVPVPRDATALLLFEQESAGAPWLLGSVSALPAGMTMPRMAVGPGGAIPQVSLSTAALLASPGVTGPLQAAVVDDGPASAATRAVAAGPLTTGMYYAARNHVFGLRPPRGDIYQWELEGVNQAKFALRTADGGALVFYAMYLNVTVAVPGYISNANPVQPGPPIRYPAALGPWVPPTGPVPRINLEEQQLLTFAAIAPPPGGSKIRVIAVGGTLNYATSFAP